MRAVARFSLLSLLGLALTPLLHAQTTRDALQVVVEGETVPLPAGGSGTVAVLNEPFVNGDGEVGFTLDVDGDDGVWFDDAVIWLNSLAAPANVLTGAEATMGIGDDGEFIYSPSVDGDDAVWTDLGLLVKDTDDAPGFPGQFISFASRPTMLPDGTAYWVSGISDVQGGSTDFDVLYASPDRTVTSATVVYAVPDPIDGQATSDLDFDYAVSDDGAHVLLGVTLAASGNSAIAVDGAIVAEEGMPTGGGDNWDNFDITRVLNDGTYAFSGDTDGDTATDEFIAVNGTIVLRQGDVVDGVALGTDVRGLDLNGNGQVLFAWSLTSTSDEGLFLADLADIAGTATLILRTGDGLDVDGDDVDDWVVTDFDFSTLFGQGAGALTDDGAAYVILDVEPAGGGTEVQGIFGFGVSSAAVAADIEPINPPIVVPAGGGPVPFSLTFTNTTASPQSFDFWLVLTTPSGGEVTLVNRSLSLGPNQVRGPVNVGINVPGGAPAGTYTLTLNVGDFPAAVDDSDSFTFEKAAPLAPSRVAPEDLVYTLSGDLPGSAPGAAAVTATPSGVVAAPNPFRAQTTLAFALDAAADVRLAVYDVLGREVAVLVDGPLEAGPHAVPFAARSLAAGAYVYRLQVGEAVRTGRMTIVR